MELTAMMHESVWFEQPQFEQDEAHYQLHLACNNRTTGATTAASALIGEIAKARSSIKKSLNEAPRSSQSSQQSAEVLEKENRQLHKLIADLTKRMGDLEARMSKLEGEKGASEVPSAKPKESAKPKDDDDDDFDLFDSDEEDEELDEKKKADKQKMLDQYHEKKARKGPLIAKSTIILDVKPWADDTDMVEVERLVRGIETDGLVWGASKLIPVAYGIKKLQIACVVEDDKVGTDYLEEAIQDFDDYVQSVDVAAFNKI